MKRLIVILLLVFSGVAWGQKGIIFAPLSWGKAVKEAIKEDKLIFIDVYTQWCGPCLLMAQEVFVLPEVAKFYNENFLNLKIDAETEEWGPIAKRYNVRSYPTYLFIDPKTEELVHLSGSRQEPETFIFTGESALKRELNSVVLQADYQANERSPEFLLRYVRYLFSIHDRDNGDRIFRELTALPGYSIENRDVWDIFVKNSYDKKSPLFAELLRSPDKYRELYGKEDVDGKLFSMFYYTPNLRDFETMPGFSGKEFLFRKNQIDIEIQGGRYEEAAQLIDELLVDPGEYLREICDFLRFPIAQAQYQEMKTFWFDKCLEYARFIAYNYPDRDNGMMHYNYAILLEKVIGSIPDADKLLPKGILIKPEFGVEEYTMRSPELKLKPSQKIR